VVCLDCLSSETEAVTIDFCDKPECWRKSFVVDPRDPQRMHQPDHDVFKVRTVLHLVDIPGLLPRAESALSLSREYFQNSESEHTDVVEDTVGKYLKLHLACDLNIHSYQRCIMTTLRIMDRRSTRHTCSRDAMFASMPCNSRAGFVWIVSQQVRVFYALTILYHPLNLWRRRGELYM
jgi:hypothetical protein